MLVLQHEVLPTLPTARARREKAQKRADRHQSRLGGARIRDIFGRKGDDLLQRPQTPSLFQW